jgi:hypothetical protein
MSNMVNGPPILNMLVDDCHMHTNSVDLVHEPEASINILDSDYGSAHRSRDVHIPIELALLAKSCASLNVVKACVASAIEKRPGIDPSVVVREVIRTLAAFEEPSTNLNAGLDEDLAKEVSTNRFTGLDETPADQPMSACGSPPPVTPSWVTGNPEPSRPTCMRDSAPLIESPRPTCMRDSRHTEQGNKIGYDLAMHALMGMCAR